MLLDNITEIKIVLTMKKIACPECGAMYSMVQIESHINRLFGKYKVILAKSKTTQSITYHRDEGSYETILNDDSKALEFRSDTFIQWPRLISNYLLYLHLLLENVHRVFVIHMLLKFFVVPMHRIHVIVICYTLLPLYDLLHISYGFNSLVTYNNICLALILSLFIGFLTYQIIILF